jgi:hypothetical protein
VIQRNALESWKRLSVWEAGQQSAKESGVELRFRESGGLHRSPNTGPPHSIQGETRPEIIVFGDEEGAADVCRELGLRHEPAVERSASGTKYVRSIFGRAQEIARHNVLAYINCDILLTGDFAHAVAQVAERFGARGEHDGEILGPEARNFGSGAHDDSAGKARAEKRRDNRFLMVGRRWDAQITAPIDFAAPDWGQRAQETALAANQQRGPDWIDYFVFSRGMYREIPPLVIGRVGWDNWLVWKARSEGAAVIDATRAVVAIHQNHDYGYHPLGQQGVWQDAEAQRNFELAGGAPHIYTMDDATHRLTPRGIVAHPGYRLAPARRAWRRGRAAVWHAILGATRPVRHALGLKKSG